MEPKPHMKKYFVKLMLMAVILAGILSACEAEVSIVGNAKEVNGEGDNAKEEKGEEGNAEEGNDKEDNAENVTNPFALSAEEQQKIDTIKARYLSIPTHFPGGYFITAPTTTPSYTLGEARNEVLQAGMDAINLVRYIAGIPDDVELDPEYTELSQHGAVLLMAVNALTHSPSKPEDMAQDFYDKGHQATSSSNISTVNLPSTTVFRYMDDSASHNVASVGHRRWILNPPMKRSAFGVGLTRYGLMYAVDMTRGFVEYEYIAWPSPGVFPTTFISNNLPWSISVNAQKYGRPDINKTEVTLKHLNSAQVWTFSSNTPSSASPPNAYYNIDQGGYGINNCIIFRPELDNSFQYKEGDVFQVVVSGLAEDLSYTVKIFGM
jgi:hypothetical protein